MKCLTKFLLNYHIHQILELACQHFEFSKWKEGEEIDKMSITVNCN